VATRTTRFPQGNIDPQRWNRLKTILGEALEQNSSAARIALVETRCGQDTDLLEEAESLLAEAEALLNERTDRFEDCAQNAASTFWQEGPPRGGERVGAYVIVRELGRGGMGTVFLAERADGQFEKQVAIKILNRGADTTEILRRFRAERQILARLDHPNIARLLDAGTTDDGLPYFIMDYIVGAPVTRFAVAQGLSMRQRLELFLKICAPVEFAHRNLVVHRDIKPSNILANAEGEPKLLDFGIAKLLAKDEAAMQLTPEAQQHLAPICASPEQAKGDPVTVATDIYSLGALLYEMLSDQKPHRFSTDRPTREELVLVVGEQVPPPPSAVASNAQTARLLRGDLDAIVLFAMRKEPAMRYATVADLAADIRNHLAREPVVARHPTLAYRAKCLVKRNGSRLVASGVVMIVLAGVLFAFWARSQQNAREAASMRARGVNAPASDTRKSIAVLPFENLGGNNNSPSYFTDGVQDNILTDLGKVGDLKVISRSGVAPYRGKNRNMKQIGRDLSVANVLEGSVQISGDRVRINAQLIDTRTDSQIWAEQYDRKLEDLFALQSELAQTIAAQLKATLSTGEKAEIWRQPTQDLQAYDLYLRARAAFLGRGGPMTRENWDSAVSLLNQAIARDPKFTLAYCLLNEVYVLRYRFGEDHSPQYLAAAKDAAETALRLEPSREEARLALARYYYHGLSDYRRTEQELSRIPSSAPHEVEFFTLASLVERRLGQFAASIRDGEKAVELDPQNGSLATSLVQTYSGLRRFRDSERVANAAIARLHGPKPRVLIVKNEAALGVGNAEEARASLDSIQDKDDMDYQTARLWLYFIERDFDGAKTFAAKATSEVKRMPDFWLTLAAVARTAGQVNEERQANMEAKRLSLLALGSRPDDATLLGALSLAEAGLGQNEEALKHARRAAEILPPSVDAVAGPGCENRLAQVLVMTGDRDGAFDKLGSLVKLPFGLNYGDLKLNPMWDDLRNDPRFDRILTKSALPLPVK
jgi:eukaryotic-like serine/threonine-protein kinase